MVLHADMGGLPETLPAKTYRALLAANYEWSMQGKGLGLSSDGERLVYFETMNLRSLQITELLSALERAAQLGEQLSAFLEEANQDEQQ